MRWLVAYCSTVVSISLIFAGALFAAIINPGISRSARSVAVQVPRALEQRFGKNATSLIRQAIYPHPQEIGPVKADTKMASSIPAPLPSGSHASVDTASTVASFVTKSPLKEILRSDVVWLFDEPGGPSLFAMSRSNGGATTTGFLIDGENASGLPLTDVQAVLIPDKNAGKLELVLSRSERPADEPVPIIPPGAQFSLAYTFSKELAGSSDSFVEKCGGAIFAFHYTHAGVRKAVIWYLSPSRLRAELRKAGALASVD